MSRRFAARRPLRWLPAFLCLAGGLKAESCLVLSPATMTTQGTALWDLSLQSPPGAEPAAVQWSFQYTSATISSLTVDDGPMLAPAGKTTFCAGDASAYTCLAVGTAAKTIGNGVIAKVTAVLTPGTTNPTILITNSLGSSLDGNLIRISSGGQLATNRNVVSACRRQPSTSSAGGGR